MAKSSINIKAVSATSEIHNKREMELDYAYPDLNIHNESWQADTIAEREKEIKAHCKEVSGRKLQKNATPIREGVVNLNDNHTMEDLKQLAKDIKENHKIDCFQIHIHRDEGVFLDREGKTIATRRDFKWKVEKDGETKKVDTVEQVKELRPDAEWKCNNHAHMIFDWQDKETGKTLKLGKASISQLQTTVSQSLKMERGELKVNSNRERLEPIEYKREKELERIKELQPQIERLEQKKNTATERNREAREAYADAQREGERLKSQYREGKEEIRLRATKLLQIGWKEPETVREFSEEEISRTVSHLNEQIPKLEANIKHYESEGRRFGEGILAIKNSNQSRELETLKYRIRILREQEEKEERRKEYLRQASEKIRQGKKPW